jgi:hypothetical protein
MCRMTAMCSMSSEQLNTGSGDRRCLP